ncbi:hypothetical protein [Candidatus Francisella endociliophora]|nr:hypothetical protein [Francisella sp. FSC1006]
MKRLPKLALFISTAFTIILWLLTSFSSAVTNILIYDITGYTKDNFELGKDIFILLYTIQFLLIPIILISMVALFVAMVYFPSLKKQKIKYLYITGGIAGIFLLGLVFEYNVSNITVTQSKNILTATFFTDIEDISKYHIRDYEKIKVLNNGNILVYNPNYKTDNTNEFSTIELKPTLYK